MGRRCSGCPASTVDEDLLRAAAHDGRGRIYDCRCRTGHAAFPTKDAEPARLSDIGDDQMDVDPS